MRSGNAPSGAGGPESGKRRVKSSTLRALASAAVFVAVGVGLAFSTGTGTPSSFGWDAVAAICPLGALETILGTWSVPVRVAAALAAAVLVALLAGKAFCSWVCPVPHVQNLFKSKKRRGAEAAGRAAAAAAACTRGGRTKPPGSRLRLDSRHGVLAGALLATAVFGFPVFCLACPVGLTFATFVVTWRFVQFNEFTWGILLFPAIVVAEVVLLRRWCGRFCPLGALLSLISPANRTLRPRVDSEACLRTAKGLACKACAAACPEAIDPVEDRGLRPMDECVRCRSCVDACPVRAVRMPFLPKGSKGSGGAAEGDCDTISLASKD